MIRILLSSILGEKRISMAELSRITKIRPNTIGEMYHECSDRLSIEHLDLICKTLDIQVGDLLRYVPDDSDEALSKPKRPKRADS